MKQRIDFVSNSSSSSFMLDYESAPQEFRDNGCTYDFEGYFKNGYLKKDLISDIYNWSYPYNYKNPTDVLYHPTTAKHISDNFMSGYIGGYYLADDKPIIDELVRTWTEIMTIDKRNLHKEDADYNRYNNLRDKLYELYDKIVENVYNAIKDDFKDFCVCEVTGDDSCEIDGENEEEYYRDLWSSTSAKFSRSQSNH